MVRPSDGNNRWLYESLVPPNITDPAEREAYIQKLMEQSGNQTKEDGNELQYFTE